MSGLFLSVQCVHAVTLASDCAIMLNVENQSDVQTEQSLASPIETSGVSLRNKPCVERGHGGRRDAVTVPQIDHWLGMRVHETAVIDNKRLQLAAARSLQQEASYAPFLPKGGPLHQESGGLNTESTERFGNMRVEKIGWHGAELRH